MSGNNGCPNDENDYERGAREERARIYGGRRFHCRLTGRSGGVTDFYCNSPEEAHAIASRLLRPDDQLHDQRVDLIGWVE
jgi:hypothetical protein